MTKAVITSITPTSATAATVVGTADANVPVSVFVGGVKKGATTANGAGAWTCNVTGLTSGSGNFTAVADVPLPAKTKSIGVDMSTITLSGSAVQTSVRPTVSAKLFLYNGATTTTRILAFYYRAQGATDWIFTGSTLTSATAEGDGSAIALYTFDAVLPDGFFEVQARAGTIEGGLLEMASNVFTVQVNKPNEAPIMPPSYTNWGEETANGKYGYLDCMRTEPSVAAGTQLGRVLTINTPKPAAAYSISGSDFTINSSTGMISVANPALTAGDYTVTITATNVSGSSNCTVQIHVQAAATTRDRYIDAVNGSDSNDGTLPSRAFKTYSTWISWRGFNPTGTANCYIKRGQTHTDAVGMRFTANVNYRTYGDPADEMAHFIGADAGGYHSATISNLRIEDIWFTGTQRCVDAASASNVTFLRLKFAGNTPIENANPLYAHAYANFRALHCVIPDDENGDGFYLRKLGGGARNTVNKIRWCYFGIPRGGGSDNMQITSERKSGMECYDVEISDNIFRHSATSNSTKGNLIVEGVTGVLITRNTFSGRYFCISSLAFGVTIIDNYCKNANLNNNSFAIGTGALGNIGTNRWIFNTVERSWWGLTVSGFSDPASGPWQRYDYEVLYNTVKNCTAFMKINRPMSGFVENNVGFSNGNVNFISQGNDGLIIATGGSYSTFSKVNNYFGTAEGPVLPTQPTVSGSLAAGSTLTVTIPSIAGATATVQWLVNNQRQAGETSTTFTVPTGAANDNYMPAFAGGPTVGVAVIYTDGSGNETVVPGRFSDGSAFAFVA